MRITVSRFVQFLFIGVTVIASAGCASVPKESVELSQTLGKGIQESRRSEMNLVNKFFEMKRSQVDQWVESEYLPEYVKNVKIKLKEAGRPETLDDVQWKGIMRIIIDERDQKQADLDKTRLYLVGRIDKHYADLIQANAGITSLLQSMVDVKEATKSATDLIKKETDGKIDLDEVDQKMTEYLKQAGAAGKTATSLYEQVKQVTSITGGKQ